MYETANKVLHSARELDLRPDQFQQVGPYQWQSVVRSVFASFANTGNPYVTWLWSHLKNPGASILCQNCLEHIKDMVAPDSAVWLLLEDWDGAKEQGNYWAFEGEYSAVLAVLANMHHIEYYIVDRRLNWMALENHHGTLIGIGEPAESFIRSIASTQQTAARDCAKRGA